MRIDYKSKEIMARSLLYWEGKKISFREVDDE